MASGCPEAHCVNDSCSCLLGRIWEQNGVQKPCTYNRDTGRGGTIYTVRETGRRRVATTEAGKTFSLVDMDLTRYHQRSLRLELCGIPQANNNVTTRACMLGQKRKCLSHPHAQWMCKRLLGFMGASLWLLVVPGCVDSRLATANGTSMCDDGRVLSFLNAAVSFAFCFLILRHRITLRGRTNY